MKTARNIKNKQKGFTVVEMLVVMIIIAALSAVLMPNFSASIDKAKEAKAKGDLRGFKTNIFFDLIEGKYDIRIARLKELIMKLDLIDDAAVNQKLSNLPAGSGSALNKYLAEFVAGEIGQEVYSPGHQRSAITGIEVPNSSVSYINSNNQGIYLAADHVRQDHGEALAAYFGYDIPGMTQAENPDIYWSATGAGSTTTETGRHVFIGHLRIRIYENK